MGYWPPTDIGLSTRQGMLWQWRDLQENYKDSGYDVLAISPQFEAPVGWRDPGGNLPFWGKGEGLLPVDYRLTSEDFWAIMEQYKPIAIMSFSLGVHDNVWLLEPSARNRPQESWYVNVTYWDDASQPHNYSWDPPFAGGSIDDYSPYSGEGPVDGDPPDPTQDADDTRGSNLPMDEIEDAIEDEFPNGEVVPGRGDGDVGSFVSEYMAYHVGWYRNYIELEYPDDPTRECLRSGHTHVGMLISAEDAATAVEVQLDELLKVLP